MASEEILLKLNNEDTVLETVSEVAYTDTLDVPQHKTAAQYSISDHVIQNPLSISVKMTVLKDELDTLIDLKNQKERLTFISETRVVDTVVISGLNYSEGTSINTCNATLKLQEIITAKVETTSESLDALTTKSETSVAASSSASELETINISSEDITEIQYSGYTIKGLNG